MKWERLYKDMRLSIDGLGIVFYSAGAVKDIPIGENFLEKEYWDPQKVAEHIWKGDIVGVCTEGDSYDFELRFRAGAPDAGIIEQCPAYLELAVMIDGDALNVIDLYWLMDWQNECPEEQRVEIEPGFYRMTLFAEPPLRAVKARMSSEEFDEYLDRPRVIYVYLNRLEKPLESEWKSGVPDIYWAYEEA